MCRLWDETLIDSANQIDELRRQYLCQLNQHIEQLSQQLFPHNCISLDYKAGWTGEATYQDCLASQFIKDREKGFTQAGPHRADIRIRLDDKSAQTAISRGQQKKLVALLKLAQLALFARSSDKTCVLLYDDLPAELDADNRQKLMSILSAMNVQVFVSAIELSQIDTSAWDSVTVFHVEHGGVEEVQG
jgi:DNA replication and repair protein RecF